MLLTLRPKLGLLAAGLFGIAHMAGAQEPIKKSFQGLELTILGIERDKVYRDVRVENEKKQDLLVVHLSVRWTPSARSLFLDDSQIRLRDNGGRAYSPALSFVQAMAEADLKDTLIDLPFIVRLNAQPQSLSLAQMSFAQLPPVPLAPTPSPTPAPTPREKKSQ